VVVGHVDKKGFGYSLSRWILNHIECFD